MTLPQTGNKFFMPLANLNQAVRRHCLLQHRTFTSVVQSIGKQCRSVNLVTASRKEVRAIGTRRLIMIKRTASSSVAFKFKTNWNLNYFPSTKFMKSRRCPLLAAPLSKNFSSFSSVICQSSFSHQRDFNPGYSVRSLSSISNYLPYGTMSDQLKIPSSSILVRRFKNTRKYPDSDDAMRYTELPMLIKHKTKVRKAPSRSGADFAEMKRRIKKKPAGIVAKKDMLICSAFATADSYNLIKLKKTLIDSEKYLPVDLPEDADGALYMHSVNDDTEIVFFEEGTVIFWNAPPTVESEVLWILEYHQHSPYEESSVREENEQINYRHKEIDTYVNNKGVITLDTRDPQKLPLEKFAISNGISHSVKLAMWENSLENFSDSIEYIPDYMSLGKPIHMSREEVMKKRGKLFALRHRINLSSDLLIASDFYWDRDHLETLYQKMCSFYSIARRTRVMNERLNHCSELVELMRLHLSEKHSTRLEWMIIVLIAVEVLFEIIHYINTYWSSDEDIIESVDNASQASFTPAYTTNTGPGNNPDAECNR